MIKTKRQNIRLDLYFILAIVALYLLLRLPSILSLPVFGDEAIYVRWSQVIKSVETLRFIPLTDGKQPLFMWLVVPFFKVIKDPLFAARIVSVLSGLGSSLSIYLFARLILKTTPAISFSTTLLYLLNFFNFFFDRLAVPDNLLNFWGALSLLFSILLAKFPRLDLAMILGIILGLSWMTKSPAIFFISLSLITFAIFNFKKITLYVYPLISVIFAFVIYNILRLGPQFHQIALRNRDYVWSIGEILKHPLDPFLPHLTDTLTIYTQYFSVPFILTFILLFFIYLIAKFKNDSTDRQKTFIVISLWFILPLIANMVFAKVFTARYILYSTVPLIFLTGFLITGYIKTNRLLALLPVFFVLFNIFKIAQAINNPYTLKLPSTESGYLNQWTSGWGIQSAADFLIDRSKKVNVIVGTEGYFGTLPDGLQIYTNNVPQLTVFGVGLGFKNIPDKLIDAKNHGDEVYLLMNQSRLELLPEEVQKVTVVKRYPKPDGDNLLLIQI